MLNIVLVEPEIPNNTGNIGRLCVGTGSRLHLIHPFGFQITDKNLKRSGLDYWVHLDWKEYQSVEEWMQQIPDMSRVFLFSSHSEKSYLKESFQDDDWLVFGKESVGLSKEVLDKFENHLTIPISPLVRSYNLANSVAFAIGEAKRQISI
ncbi:tRNA methyltransferase [Flavobacterium sp. Leaf359]|uniref:tRNA (cytidine(34)-2'-O)-methyltransferase n=1 Tax=Flavobacterium sp. Leaf359 TaxID=1736351 RepID=UPI0006FB63F6|nr:tRNA (cytidine(34)-2'-O)-methyltransferase [Flavobacterium sp. Leaf359]KQS46137.1 tRNA methyltransferase [Flavobacterium sp. Leaf359]